MNLTFLWNNYYWKNKPFSFPVMIGSTMLSLFSVKCNEIQCYYFTKLSFNESKISNIAYIPCLFVTLVNPGEVLPQTCKAGEFAAKTDTASKLGGNVMVMMTVWME